MSTPRRSLYERLPEIYRIRDEEQYPPGQLRAYLAVLDEVFAGIRNNIEALYHDLFIETCDDWVVPYIADLLGASHLSGESWTLRADVARTIHHRRRKGTLGAIESLTYTLSGWAVHTVELRERLLWNQHLNHQRPDIGGGPPLRARAHLSDAVRGGTVTLRNPAVLSFLDGPFDPFARVVDVKPRMVGAPRCNLPNLAIFLWRLQTYTIPLAKPVCALSDLSGTRHDAAFAVRCTLHPLGEPMQLFNVHRFQADEDPPNLATEDATPGPIPMSRLTQDTPAGRPWRYVKIAPYDPTVARPAPPGEVGLTLHVPLPVTEDKWRVRGANLCAWEDGLYPSLREYEVVIDPEHGRVLFGVTDSAEAEVLEERLLVSPTYAFSGPTGAHPIARSSIANVVVVDAHDPSTPTLQQALDNIDTQSFPLVIEIRDSMTHQLDLTQPLRLKGELHVRAASRQRPVIRLLKPLRFRAADLSEPGAVNVQELNVILEGLYLTRQEGFTEPLIQQAAVNRLLLDGCTLDPGGAIALDGAPDGTRQPIFPGVRLDQDYGYSGPAEMTEKTAFETTQQIPEIVVQRCICGPLAMDENYTLVIIESILDAGSGVDDATPALAVYAATGDPEHAWGPTLVVSAPAPHSQAQMLTGMTCFGRMRVFRASGEGGIWVHRLEVHDNQAGCIKFSYFSGAGDRLPPHHGCVSAAEARLRFVSEVFGQPGYGQLRLQCDRRILEDGPGRDAMGAFGYLKNAPKWKNLNIRYREFMPVGVQPVLIPVT